MTLMQSMFNGIADAIQFLSNHKGQNLWAVWLRSAKVKKTCPFEIHKMVVTGIRGGIDYGNTAAFKATEAGQAGLAPEPLPWGHWVKFPVHIQHTGKDNVTRDYLRLYPAAGPDNIRLALAPKVTWYLQGQPVEFNQVAPYLLASEFPKDEEPACFTIGADTLIRFEVMT